MWRLSANTTRAEAAGDAMWRLSGHKWFMSAPMCDAFLMLAQTGEGLSCFLVPRILVRGPAFLDPARPLHYLVVGPKG
jgi:putative acyl-CoA dehydrogenase